MSDEHENAKAGPRADDAKGEEKAATDAPGTEAPGTGEAAAPVAEDEPAASVAEDEPAGEAAEDEPAEEVPAEEVPAEEVPPEDEIAEREDTAKYAVANFARDMLSAADNLRRALDAIPKGSPGDDESLAALIEGVQLTERALLSVFERHGIRKIDPMGEKFDHDRHEAMFEVPTNDAAPGTVVQVVELGYLIHDRLLRAAKVGIAKAPPDAGEEHVLDTTV